MSVPRPVAVGAPLTSSGMASASATSPRGLLRERRALRLARRFSRRDFLALLAFFLPAVATSSTGSIASSARLTFCGSPASSSSSTRREKKPAGASMSTTCAPGVRLRTRSGDLPSTRPSSVTVACGFTRMSNPVAARISGVSGAVPGAGAAGAGADAAGSGAGAEVTGAGDAAGAVLTGFTGAAFSAGADADGAAGGATASVRAAALAPCSGSAGSSPR